MTELQYNKATKINISVLVTVILFVIIHLSASLWWASSITTRQDIMIQQLTDVKKTIETHIDKDYINNDAVKDLTYLNKRIDLLETRIIIVESKNVKAP